MNGPQATNGARREKTAYQLQSYRSSVTSYAVRRTPWKHYDVLRLLVKNKEKNEANQLLQAEAGLLVREQLREVWGRIRRSEGSGESLVGSDSRSAGAAIEVVVEGSSNRPKPRYK